MRKLPYLLLALLVYLLAPASPLFAQTEPTPLSLADYQARLTRITQTLETTDDQAAALRAAQAELAAIQQVRLASGQVVTVQSLLQLNDDDQPTPAIALARLHLVLDQLAAAPNDQTATRLAQLDAVFARHEFNTPQSLWQRFIRWLRSHLPDVEISPGGGENGGAVTNVIIWTIAGVGVLLLIFLLSYWLQGLLGSFVSDFEARRRAADGEEMPLTATAARAQASASAQAGNYRQAVRQLYLSALLALEEQNLIRYDRSLTNREVLAQVRSQPGIQHHLQPVVETFDDVWYGIHEPDQATFDGYAREVDQLVGQQNDKMARWQDGKMTR